MKIFEIYNHNGGEEVLKSNSTIWDEIKNVLSNHDLKLEKRQSRYIKKEVLNDFNELGWADSIKIFPSNLTFNFIKRKVGFCLQLGNVARTYADLLKIQVLFERKAIDVGVIAVPSRQDSKKIGNNYAQYERLLEELKLFSTIIKAPIILIGLTD